MAKEPWANSLVHRVRNNSHPARLSPRLLRGHRFAHRALVARGETSESPSPGEGDAGSGECVAQPGSAVLGRDPTRVGGSTKTGPPCRTAAQVERTCPPSLLACLAPFPSF